MFDRPRWFTGIAVLLSFVSLHALNAQEREELYGALLELGNWSLWTAVEDRQGRAAEAPAARGAAADVSPAAGAHRVGGRDGL